MSVRQTAHRAYTALENIFSDKEAWTLFRLAAFVETFGWTCLIIGITAVVLKWPQNDVYIAIAGSIHGILYLFYLFIVIFTHRSLKWSVWRFIFAELISVVPYGALLFELWLSHRRKRGKI
jgi:integral membrane protein